MKRRPFLRVSRRQRGEWAKASTVEACGHPGAKGPCVARIQDGKCIWCERDLEPAGPAKVRVKVNLAHEIALKAFREGFAIGAAGKLARNHRHTVDAATHEHWRQGFEAGKRSLENNTEGYRHGFLEAKAEAS